MASSPEGSGRPPVMYDVARAAGVSHMTVSRVLNGYPHVRPQVREKVLAAISELGYRPNSLARALVTKQSRTLGVVSFDTTLHGPAAAMLGIEQAAHAVGYSVSIVSVSRLDKTSTTEALDRLVGQAVEGVLVIAPQVSAARALSQVTRPVPIVAIGGGGTRGSMPSASVDQVAGAEAVTEHLLGLGHRTVWHVSGPPDWQETRRRITGWRRALRKAGAEEPPVVEGDWSPHSGWEAGRTLAEARDATAVFVANDQMAIGVLRALQEAGKRVPDDVSVAGFDDVPEAAYLMPPLTTVRQDFDEVGRRGVQLLIDKIRNAEPDRTHDLIPPELVVRQSTAPPLRH